MKSKLLILHGALGCGNQFEAWAKALSINFECQLLDLSGHGTRAGEDVRFSIERFSSDLGEFIAKNGFTGINILGYSMGGYVALCTALQKPGLIGNIMTLATKFDWNAESSKKEAGYLKPQLMLEKVPQLAAQLKERHGAHWEKVAERTAEMMISLGEKPILTSENIRGISNRVKFCVGDKDKMVNVAETQAMFKGAVNASLSVLPNTGHLPETMDVKRIVFEAQDLSLQANPGSSRG